MLSIISIFTIKRNKNEVYNHILHFLLAEGVGLEPTSPLRGAGFQDQCLSQFGASLRYRGYIKTIDKSIVKNRGCIQPAPHKRTQSGGLYLSVEAHGGGHYHEHHLYKSTDYKYTLGVPFISRVAKNSSLYYTVIVILRARSLVGRAPHLQ